MALVISYPAAMEAQALPDSRRLERIGEYAVHRVIGEGGMGIVYEATERLSGRKVALKVLSRALTHSDEARARFFAEMRIMAGLEHPNIVRSLSNLEVDGKLLIVLEFLEGRTLRAELGAHGRLPPPRAISIARDVASALVFAHGMQPPIVHRDLKPENLMVLTDGRVKVMDFGIAKVLGDKPGLTRGAEAIGTVQYMSPEQAEGGAITQQTDLHALGLVLYEMLTGRPPFEAPSMLGLLRQHVEATPPPLSDDVRQQIPAALETLVFALLQKVPHDRPPGAAAVVHALEALMPAASVTGAKAMLAVPSGAAFASAAGRTPLALRVGKQADTIELLDRFDKKKRWPWIAGGLALAVVAAAIAVPWVMWAHERARPRPKTSRSAVATATPNAPPPSSTLGSPGPVDVAAETCARAEICGPFNPATPASLEAEAVIAQADRFVRGVDASARLMGASFEKCVVAGRIDMTRPGANVNLQFATANGVIALGVSITHFIGRRRTFSSEPDVLAAAPCTLKRAFDAALAVSFPFNANSSANLTTGVVSDLPEWRFRSPSGGFDQAARVDARDCSVEFTPKKVDLKR